MLFWPRHQVESHHGPMQELKRFEIKRLFIRYRSSFCPQLKKHLFLSTGLCLLFHYLILNCVLEFSPNGIPLLFLNNFVTLLSWGLSREIAIIVLICCHHDWLVSHAIRVQSLPVQEEHLNEWFASLEASHNRQTTTREASHDRQTTTPVKCSLTD